SHDVTATASLYPLSLHDALPIFGVFCVSDLDAVLIGHILAGRSDRHRGDHWRRVCRGNGNGKILYRRRGAIFTAIADTHADIFGDRKSTRLNSSHVKISYAVFCL